MGLLAQNALDTYVWPHIGPFWRKNGPGVNNWGFRILPVFTMGNVFRPQIPLGKAEESVWGVICDPPKGTSDDPGWGPLLQGVWAGGVKKGQNLTRFSANFHSMCPVLEGWKFGYLEFLDKKIFLDWFRDARECFKVFSCASAKWYLIRYHLSLFFPNASSYPKSEGTLWSKTFDFTYSVVFKKPFRGSLSCLNRNLF